MTICVNSNLNLGSLLLLNIDVSTDGGTIVPDFFSMARGILRSDDDSDEVQCCLGGFVIQC
jgi:hypothetical protein